MADEKRCGYVHPHPFHGWEEVSPITLPARRLHHVCPGTEVEPHVSSTWVRNIVKRRADLIEWACERMLVTPGDYGVLIHEWQELDLEQGGARMNVRVRLSVNVPAMTVETHQTNPTDCARCEGRSP